MNDTFTIGRQRFSCGIDPRTGTLCIQSIHPYDETNYHWARQGVTGHSWFVFLLNLDRQAHLTRTGGIW